MVTVWPLEGYGVGLDGNTAVSCASGKAALACVPPFVNDQIGAEAPQLPDTVLRKYTVLAAGNVIPLLPLASPSLVPLTGAAAPAMVMSRKSMSVKDAIELTVNVLAVPKTLETTIVRHVEFAPELKFNTPLIVWFPPKEAKDTPEVARP